MSIFTIFYINISKLHDVSCTTKSIKIKIKRGIVQEKIFITFYNTPCMNVWRNRIEIRIDPRTCTNATDYSDFFDYSDFDKKDAKHWSSPCFFMEICIK